MSSDPSIADREILTWELFGTAVRDLAQQVADDDFVPDLVLGIARGGLPIAGGLAYALGAKAVGTVNVEFYTGIDAHLTEPVLLPPLLDLEAVTGSTVLVVDDVADSGRTLDLVLRLVSERVARARTAVIYDKPRSVIRPDYSWRATDRWIVFPWSAQPPVTPGRPGEQDRPDAQDRADEQDRADDAQDDVLPVG